MLDRVSIAMTGLATITVAAPGINNISVPFLGVPLTAITMAAAGAACSFAWAQENTSRAKLFWVVLASTFVGSTCVSVVPKLMGLQWPSDLQPPLAFIFGLIAPWVVPATKSAIPAFFKGLANMLVKMVGAKVDAPTNNPYQNYDYQNRDKDGDY